MALGKGIPLINGFDLNSKLPLDSRTVADTKENMNKLVTDGSVGDGQLCYCKADKKLYVLKDNVWSEVGGGSGDGQAMFNIAQYADDATMTMTEEGYNLLYDGLRSGKYAGIVFGYWNAYPICIDDTYSLRFQYMNFEPDSPNDIYKMLIIDKNTKKISGLPWDEGSQNMYLYSAFYTKPSLKPTTNTIPCLTPSGQQNLTIGDGLAIENGVLKATGGSGGGKSVPPTLNLVDTGNGTLRTTITEEEYNNLKNGLYNQVIFPGLIPNELQAFMPSKLIGDESFGADTFIQFDCVASGNTTTINALSVYGYSFGAKDTNGNYPITIEKQMDVPVGGNSGGSSKIWYELPSLFFLENITQEQFDEIKNLALQNQLAGINCAGLYCPLIFYNDGQNITFFYPWYENDIFTAQLIILDTNLSVKKTPYSTITLPQTAPTSQLIPSITTSNTQQNLTIGDGLKIENGALKATGGGSNVTVTFED